MSGKPATRDSSITFRHSRKVRQSVSTELLCRINTQLRWRWNPGVGRSGSVKGDRCGSMPHHTTHHGEHYHLKNRLVVCCV